MHITFKDFLFKYTKYSKVITNCIIWAVVSIATIFIGKLIFVEKSSVISLAIMASIALCVAIIEFVIYLFKIYDIVDMINNNEAVYMGFEDFKKFYISNSYEFSCDLENCVYETRIEYPGSNDVDDIIVVVDPGSFLEVKELIKEVNNRKQEMDIERVKNRVNDIINNNVG